MFLEHEYTDAKIYNDNITKEILLVNCNNIKIIQATGIAIKPSNPLPNTFKEPFPIYDSVLFKNLGANHKHSNHTINTKAMKLPKLNM